MSKLKYLDNVNKQITDSMFYVDQRYMKSLSPILSDWFKKMKPLPGFSRIFQDYNKRYFTINLVELSLYYSIKKNYSLDEITYIPFQEIVEIKDKPHYALSNQGVEWKEAFGFTIYLRERYIILVAQSNATYQQWLNHFESIRNKQTGQSILIRTRTPFYSQLFSDKITDGPKQNKENYVQPEKMVRIEQIKENKKIQETIVEQSVPEVLIQHKCETELIDKYDDFEDKQEFLEIQETQQKKIIPQEIKYQPDEPQDIPKIINSQKQLFIEAPIEEEKVEENANQKVEEQIIRFGEKQDSQQNQQKTKEIMIQPIRLDSTRKQPKGQEQNKLQGIEKQTTNIWQDYDKDGNPKQIPSIRQNCFIEPYFLKQNEELDQPDFLIRFDEMDSSR